MGYKENCIPTYLIIISENIPLFIQSKVGCFFNWSSRIECTSKQLFSENEIAKAKFLFNFLENLENDNSFLSPIDGNYKNGLIEISAVILLQS